MNFSAKNILTCRKSVSMLLSNKFATKYQFSGLLPQKSVINFPCKAPQLNKCNITYCSLRNMCMIPKNPIEEFYTASQQTEKGAIYDKKPFKMTCEAGKKYSWCVCGKSKSQPLCDGTHKNVFLKIKFRPVRFTVTETKEYYLCNCKQTNNRPFCDGTHKQEAIQGASIK